MTGFKETLWTPNFMQILMSGLWDTDTDEPMDRQINKKLLWTQLDKPESKIGYFWKFKYLLFLFYNLLLKT